MGVPAYVAAVRPFLVHIPTPAQKREILRNLTPLLCPSEADHLRVIQELQGYCQAHVDNRTDDPVQDICLQGLHATLDSLEIWSVPREVQYKLVKEVLETICIPLLKASGTRAPIQPLLGLAFGLGGECAETIANPIVQLLDAFVTSDSVGDGNVTVLSALRLFSQILTEESIRASGKEHSRLLRVILDATLKALLLPSSDKTVKLMKLKKKELAKERMFLVASLLPTLMQFSDTIPKDELLTRLWSTLQLMHESPDSAIKSQFYTTLCLFYDNFFPPIDAGLDLRCEKFFWEAMQKGVTADETFTQKRCIYLLKRIVEDTQKEKREQDFCDYFNWSLNPPSATHWRTFFNIWEALDQFSLHILKPVWKDLPKIYPAKGSKREAIHSSWIQLIYEQAWVHRNVGFQRYSLIHFFEFDFDKYALWMDHSTLCAAFMNASKPWLFRYCPPLEIATYNKGNKGKGGQIRPEEEYDEWSAMFKNVLNDFFTSYFAHLPSCKERQRLITSLLSTAEKQQLHCVGQGLVLKILTIMERQPGDGALLDTASLKLLHSFITNRVQGRFPLFIEVRMQAACFQLFLNFMGPPGAWATPESGIAIDEVAMVLNAMLRGGTIGHAAERCGPSGGYGGALAIRLFPKCRDMILKWFQQAPPQVEHTLTTYIQKGVDWILGPEMGTIPEVHEKVQRMALFIPCLMPAKGTQLLTPLFDALNGIHLRMHMPCRTKLKLMVALQEFLLIAKDVPEDNFNPCTMLAEGSSCADVRALLMSSVQFCATNAQGSLPTEEVDIYMGTIYVLSTAFSQITWIFPAIRNAVTYLDQYNTSLAKVECPVNTHYTYIISLRNAISVIQTVCQLYAENSEHASAIADLMDAGAVVKALLVLELPNIGGAKTDLTPLSLSSFLEQFNRYRWNSMAVLVSSLSKTQKMSSEFASEVYQMSLSSLSSFACSPFNVSSIFDVMRLTLPLRAPPSDEEVKVLLTAFTASLKGLERKEVTRSYSNILAMLCSMVGTLSEAGQVLVCNYICDTLDKVGEALLRVRYCISFLCCASLMREYKLGKSGSKAVPIFQLLNKVFMKLLAFSQVKEVVEKDDDALFMGSESLKTIEEEWGLRAMYPYSVNLDKLVRIQVVSAFYAIAKDWYNLKGQTHPIIEELVHQLLAANHLPELNSGIIMPNSLPHKSRIRIWQTLCSLCGFIDDSLVEAIVPKIESCLAINNVGSVRLYIELFSIALAQKSSSLQAMVASGLQNTEAMPQVQCSLLSIAGHVIISSKGPTSADLLGPIIASLTSHQYRVRLYAQVMLHQITTFKKTKDDPLFESLMNQPLLKSVCDFITTQSECVKWREKNADYMRYDIDRGMSLKDIFSQRRREGEMWVQEYVPPADFKRIGCVAEEYETLTVTISGMDSWRASSVLELAIDHPIPVMSDAKQGTVVYPSQKGDEVEEEEEAAVGHTIQGDNDNFQQKIQTWSKESLENEVNPRNEAPNRPRQPVKLVATFVENPINIAALCRISEVFSLQSLVVHSKKVTARSEFIATSVSSENWVPMEEVTQSGLPAWLQKHKEEGWALMGVEQTAESHPLQEFQFSEGPVVLVLGAEKEGIPVDIIQLLDDCVEIPQLGVIRSLNVHVSAAITAYEYTQQALKRKGIEEV